MSPHFEELLQFYRIPFLVKSSYRIAVVVQDFAY
ncbi:Uncharacterised protein [Paenibacillus thiaminolyticus]|nr:Uncharacterised protein [Paenibacillus thiaminolyticus]